MSQPDKMIHNYESMMMKGRAGSATAEGVALLRAWETTKPADERVCYDPYAIRFVRPEILAHLQSRTPEQREEEHRLYEQRFPGHRNTVLMRVRFIDDQVRDAIAMGISQIVIVGAGYDTRASRVPGMDRVRVFELDHGETQEVKKKIVAEIFGVLPPHVTYIPLDLIGADLQGTLVKGGWSPTEKTIFILEGLLCYLPQGIVTELLSGLARTVAGSLILCDFFPQSVVDGSDACQVARNIHEHVRDVGEPFVFGIPNNEIYTWFFRLGYSQVTVVRDEEFRDTCGGGIFRDRSCTGLLYFVRACTNP